MQHSLKDISDIMLGGALGAKDILIQLKGDNTNLKNAMSDSDKSMGNLTNSVKKYGPAMAAAFAVGTAAFVANTVKMAAAEEVVNRQTESMLKSQGIMWSEVKGEVTGYINELERLTAYGDTDLQMAFNRMSSSGMGYTATMESMKMVTDIAYTKDMDLVTAADLVSKAYNGQASSLKRYGIIVENGLVGMEALNAVQLEISKNFADASERTETLEGKMDLLTTATDDFKEALGTPLLEPLSEFVGLLAEGAEEGEGFAAKIGEALAFPLEVSTASMRLKPLEEELAMIKELEYAGMLSAEGEKRKHKVIIEMLQIQNGEYENRKEYIDDIKKAEEEIIDTEESLYFIQLRKMGASQEYINSLKQQLEVEKEITQEGENQLSLSERKAAADARAKTASGFSGISSSDLAGLKATAGAYAAGEAYTRTSGGRTITYAGTKSGAP